MIRPMADHVLRVAASESDPWPQTLTLIVRLLQNLPLLADRLALIETVSSDSVSVVQYVDDTTAPCPITRRDADSACHRYARWAKAAFNYGPSKTAVMALCSDLRHLVLMMWVATWLRSIVCWAV